MQAMRANRNTYTGTKLQSSLLDPALAGADPDSRADNRVKHSRARGSPLIERLGRLDSAKYEALTRNKKGALHGSFDLSIRVRESVESRQLLPRSEYARAGNRYADVGAYM